MANKHLFKTAPVATLPKKAKKATKGKEKPVVEDQSSAEGTTQKAETKHTKGKKVKTTGALKPKKVSMIDAAQKVLADAKEAMTCPDMIEAMAKKNLWSSPNGKTPANTLYAAISRIIKEKGKQSPFKKTDKGQFAFNG